MSMIENNENAGFHASLQSKSPYDSAVTEDSPARSDGRSVEAAPSFNCGEIRSNETRVPVSAFTSIEDASPKTIQEKWNQEKPCSSMEISHLEPSLSISNGGSSKEDVENILLAGVTGGPTDEVSKTRNGKEGEINGGKNLHPSNEKI